jgi:BMFP domain-containing protein YqiC
MTQTNNRLMDELAKLVTNAAGAAQGVRTEVDSFMKTQAEKVLNDMDIVSREEFEAVRDMAVKAREENDALLKRIDALEAMLKKVPTKATQKKPKN